MNSSITHTIDGKYIKEWLVLGPFFPDDLETDFLADVGGEANIEPKESDTVTTADGKTLAWKQYDSKADIIDLLDAVGDYENATAYAFCILQSEVAGDAQIYLGSDDGIAVWINGVQVHLFPGDRELSPDEDVFEADLKAGTNRCLVKVSNVLRNWGFTMRALPPNRAIISGTITDGEGEPIAYAEVCLEQDEKRILQRWTDLSGNYRVDIYPVHGQYDLSATSGDLGDWQLGIQLNEGERRELNLTLKEAISIEGTLLMLDDATPHVAVPVQAICNEEVIATRLSDGRGKYRFINLKPGQYQVRCQVLGGYVYYRSSSNDNGMEEWRDGMEEKWRETLEVTPGTSLSNIDFRFPSFKKGTWRHYTVIDGLASMFVHDIHQDLDGALWFASCSADTPTGSGVSRYDGKKFVVFTTEDGLAGNDVFIIHSAADGVMWFGTFRDGVSRYDGKEFVNLTKKDGLVSNAVIDIYPDPDGVMWFATYGGVSRYDGEEFVNFTIKDGLPSDEVITIHRDSDGVMWFGTDGAGVSCYNGKEFVNLRKKDGLVSNTVIDIHRDPDGIMWFGTGYPGGGISRYDGKEFKNFTQKDGLPNNRVWAIHGDADGVMWFGTDGGVSRYDGKGFVNFTTVDGLLSGIVEAILRDPDGGLWFGTNHGGVSRYDENSFVTFTTKDGLPHNVVQAVHRDADGSLWVGTAEGLARYDSDGMECRAPITFSPEDGLVPGAVSVIHRAPDGKLWFGTGFYGPGRGVFRYESSSGDGSSFFLVNFITADGLAHNDVWSIHSDADGVMWFGTMGGVSRYDGKEFVNLITEDGLGGNEVYAIHRDPDGVMWFGTNGGASRYDGREFVSLTTEDGLPNNFVFAIDCFVGFDTPSALNPAPRNDPDGIMWFGTNGGVSRYDGKEFKNFTTEDGLASNAVLAVHSDADGVMWFGTHGGGVSGYDGVAWTSLDTRDGLADNRVLSIESDTDGTLWFATFDGLTRYRRSKIPPRVYIISVTTDQTYRDLDTIPAFILGMRVTIEYNSIDFKTLPGKRQYRCRIKELDTDWRGKPKASVGFDTQATQPKAFCRPTKAASFDCVFDKPGTYTFEVQAIDRDLNYSEPATVEIEIIPDPRSHQIAQLESDLENRNQELEQANRELDRSNQDLEQTNAELQRLSNFKSHMLSVVSHELRTPLTSIDGFTRLIHERFLTDDLITQCNDATRPTIQRVKDRVEIIRENTSRLARLINDLLDFSRIERGRELEMHFSRIELSDVIETVIATYQTQAMEKGLTLKYGGEVPLHAGELMVYGDADRLTQVFSNLVSNAVKFTPEEGLITIGTRKNKGLIELTVQDTGVGIPKEQLATIFEPFEQAGETDAKKSGTGLGLAIVKYIVERHDGTVRVASEEGVGSTFIIALPEYVVESPVRTTPQRILIVDDDYDILRLLEEGLSAYPNTRIITASSSQDALKILETQPCDVMITDVRMPGDISGIELATQVKEKYPELKVFVMTNTPEEKERVIQLQSDWIDKAMPNLIHYIAKKIGRE